MVRSYVHDVKNIKAGDLADRLSEVFSGQRSEQQLIALLARKRRPGLQPVQAKGGTNAVNSTPGGTGSSGVGGSMGNLRSGSQSDGGGGSHAGSFKLGDSEDEVRISAVSENNQLLVMRMRPASGASSRARSSAWTCSRCRCRSRPRS